MKVYCREKMVVWKADCCHNQRGSSLRVEAGLGAVLAEDATLKSKEYVETSPESVAKEAACW